MMSNQLLPSINDATFDKVFMAKPDDWLQKIFFVAVKMMEMSLDDIYIDLKEIQKTLDHDTEFCKNKIIEFIQRMMKNKTFIMSHGKN
jgi:hypothetical protein